MSKPSIKTITVKYLINFLLVLAVILLIITGFNFRTLSKNATENQALAHAELVKAGLTAHMKAGIMDKRDYYLNEIRQLHQINRLQIIRSEEVNAQFGPGKHFEKATDNVPMLAFASKQPVFLMNEWAANPTMRVIIPYIASSNGALNCLNCHDVKEGTVLGVVDIEIDVTDYRNYSLLMLIGVLCMSSFFLFLIVLNTSRTIHQHVQTPLETLIDHAKEAYKEHTPVSSDQFATQEFTRVASEINLFNSEIIAHQDLLQQKNEELISLNDEIEKTLRETIYTMGVIEEQRSKETNNHTRRVTLYSQLLATKLGLSERDIDLVTAASPLHDIGKLGIPDEILFKPRRLTDEEYKVMENHTRIGHAMLSHSERDVLKAASVIAQQHHEKWDGSGYPHGLKGEEIHVYGRIVALADVFDALISRRIYKDPWDSKQAAEWISNQKDKHFDPTLVDIFTVHLDEFLKIAERYPCDSKEGTDRLPDELLPG